MKTNNVLTAATSPFTLSESVQNSQKLFHADAGEFMSQEEALTLQANHLRQKAAAGDFAPVRSEFIGIENLMKLLSQPGCTGLKVIYGADEEGKSRVVLTAADQNAATLETNRENFLGFGPICPLWCD